MGQPRLEVTGFKSIAPDLEPINAVPSETTALLVACKGRQNSLFRRGLGPARSQLPVAGRRMEGADIWRGRGLNVLFGYDAARGSCRRPVRIDAAVVSRAACRRDR
jgi:hypothetical protein